MNLLSSANGIFMMIYVDIETKEDEIDHDLAHL